MSSHLSRPPAWVLVGVLPSSAGLTQAGAAHHPRIAPHLGTIHGRMAPTITPGTRLGSYEILTVLDEGGMGAVYLVQDTKLNRRLRSKVLLPQVAHNQRCDDVSRKVKADRLVVHALTPPGWSVDRRDR